MLVAIGNPELTLKERIARLQRDIVFITPEEDAEWDYTEGDEHYGTWSVTRENFEEEVRRVEELINRAEPDVQQELLDEFYNEDLEIEISEDDLAPEPVVYSEPLPPSSDAFRYLQQVEFEEELEKEREKLRRQYQREEDKRKSMPLWQKVGAFAIGGYFLGKRIVKW